MVQCCLEQQPIRFSIGNCIRQLQPSSGQPAQQRQNLALETRNPASKLVPAALNPKHRLVDRLAALDDQQASATFKAHAQPIPPRIIHTRAFHRHRSPTWLVLFGMHILPLPPNRNRNQLPQLSGQNQTHPCQWMGQGEVRLGTMASARGTRSICCGGRITDKDASICVAVPTVEFRRRLGRQSKLAARAAAGRSDRGELRI